MLRGEVPEGFGGCRLATDQALVNKQLAAFMDARRVLKGVTHDGLQQIDVACAEIAEWRHPVFNKIKQAAQVHVIAQ